MRRQTRRHAFFHSAAQPIRFDAVTTSVIDASSAEFSNWKSDAAQIARYSSHAASPATKSMSHPKVSIDRPAAGSYAFATVVCVPGSAISDHTAASSSTTSTKKESRTPRRRCAFCLLTCFAFSARAACCSWALSDRARLLVSAATGATFVIVVVGWTPQG